MLGQDFSGRLIHASKLVTKSAQDCGLTRPRRSCEDEEPRCTVTHENKTLHGAWVHRELLIDCEEDRTLRAVLVGMLREADAETQD